MKKTILLLITLFIALPSIAQYVYVVFEGYQPKDKKYYFDIKKPDNFDVSKYQYMIWKTLKDNGYELTDSANADIVVKVNYMAIEIDAQTNDLVVIGQDKTIISGIEVTVPKYGTKISDHYKETHNQLDLRAHKKGANENSLPIWHIYSPRNLSDISQNLMVSIKYLWFSVGETEVVLSEGNNNSFKKAKINKKKLSEQELSVLNKINMDFTNMNDAEEYNNQINTK